MISSARCTTASVSDASFSSWSHLTNSRNIPAWSNISCAQWIGRLREPNMPDSVIGVRPAISRIGAWSRLALAAPLTMLAVPTLTCTITACGLPVAR